MKIKIQSNITAIVIAAALAALTTQAVTYTWDGGSTVDSNWSTGENWDPDGSPVSASDTWVKFTGNTRPSSTQNIAAPFTLNRFDFLGGSTYTAAITAGGNSLLFVTNGVTQPRIYLARNATCTINNAIDVPADTTLNLDIGTYGVNLNGLITGEGSLDKSAASGGISLYHADNTFSGGLTIRANNSDWAKFGVYASGAMGTGPVKLYGGSMRTDLKSPGGLNFYNTTTHTNSIGLFQNSPIFTGMPNGTAAVTLKGDIDLNTYTLHLRGGGIGTIDGVISEGTASAIIKNDPGTWTLAGNNTFTGSLTVNNGTIKLGSGNALDPQVGLSLACTTGWSFGTSATLDLNGFNQTISQLDGSIATAGLNNILTSTAAAVLTVDQSSTTVFNGSLTGALSLIKEGAGTLTLSNSLTTTTGDITVSNGTLVVEADANLGNGATVTVAGGTLELRNAASIADPATLAITNGAQVLIAAGLTETVDRLFLNGIQQPRGTYGTTASGAMFTNDSFFDGTGLIYVESNPPVTPTLATWDAEGANTLMSTPENWVGDALPAFDGTTHAIFGNGGNAATVDTAVSLYGMTFNRDGNFALDAGAGVISNAMDGILAEAPNATARTYTIAEDLLLSDNQTWAVSNATLNVTGAIDDGFLPSTLTKTGLGPLMLTASNTFDGAIEAYEGDLRIYHSQALGSTNGNTTIRGGNGARLLLYGNMNIEEPLVLNGEKNNNGTLRNESGSNTLSGPIFCYSQVRLNVYGTALVISGGVTAMDANDNLFVINSGAKMIFDTKPLKLGPKRFYTDSGGLTVLAVSGNEWADTLVASGTLRCGVPDALPPTASLRIGVSSYAPNGTLDLNGFDQTTSRLYIDSPIPGNRKIISTTPAQLTVNQSANTTIDARFTGAVSLLKLGTGNLTLTNDLTDTTGSFVVSNGTLTVGNNGTLGNNSTNIVVTGTGTLALQNSTAISDTAFLRITEDGAKVNLATGVNETVGYLIINDVNMPVGSYGTTGSGAMFPDDTHFTGTGILTVLRSQNPGTMIILR